MISFENLTRISCPHRQDNLPDVHSCHRSIGLAKGAAHASLQPIGTGARQHLVDTDDVVWMSAHAQVESFFAGNLDEVFVGTNAGSLKRFGAQLLIFVGHEVNAAGELVDVGALATEIKDADFGVRHTTIEAGFGVGLQKI